MFTGNKLLCNLVSEGFVRKLDGICSSVRTDCNERDIGIFYVVGVGETLLIERFPYNAVYMIATQRGNVL